METLERLMNPTDMPIFGMMKSRMDMLGQRQKVLASNVANVSTPGYVPSDVDVAGFNEALSKARSSQAAASSGGVAMAKTQTGHMSPVGQTTVSNVMDIQKSPDSETTLDGNAVVAEEQMMKMSETRMEFETMISLYNKSLALMRIAAKSPR
jgi:flagellar basal-body rod protein FlgB